MSKFVHTEKCLEFQKRLEDKLKEFDLKYPNCCKTCGGSGEIHYRENQSPIGSGERWMMDEVDICPECIENGICPLCGEEFNWQGKEWDLDFSFCKKCGYDSRNEHPIIRPWEWDGDCNCENIWLKEHNHYTEDDWLEQSFEERTHIEDN